MVVAPAVSANGSTSVYPCPLQPSPTIPSRTQQADAPDSLQLTWGEQMSLPVKGLSSSRPLPTELTKPYKYSEAQDKAAESVLHR